MRKRKREGDGGIRVATKYILHTCTCVRTTHVFPARASRVHHTDLCYNVIPHNSDTDLFVREHMNAFCRATHTTTYDSDFN